MRLKVLWLMHTVNLMIGLEKSQTFFFENSWIHATVKKGKTSGAFSHPTVPSCHPCILINYQGKIRDVMTLAHELGHGIHLSVIRYCRTIYIIKYFWG